MGMQRSGTPLVSAAIKVPIPACVTTTAAWGNTMIDFGAHHRICRGHKDRWIHGRSRCNQSTDWQPGKRGEDPVQDPLLGHVGGAETHHYQRVTMVWGPR